MTESTVAILRTSPRTVLSDYHELMNLAGYQQTIDRAVDTALKINISWHFFFPAASTTPWQLEGVIRALKQDGFDPALLHACHNRTMVQMGKALGALLRTSFEISTTRKDGPATSLPLHRAVLDAVIARDPARAEQAILVLIDGARKDIDQVLATRKRLPRISRPATQLKAVSL